MSSHCSSACTIPSPQRSLHVLEQASLSTENPVVARFWKVDETFPTTRYSRWIEVTNTRNVVRIELALGARRGCKRVHDRRLGRRVIQSEGMTKLGKSNRSQPWSFAAPFPFSSTNVSSSLKSRSPDESAHRRPSHAGAAAWDHGLRRETGPQLARRREHTRVPNRVKARCGHDVARRLSRESGSRSTATIPSENSFLSVIRRSPSGPRVTRSCATAGASSRVGSPS